MGKYRLTAVLPCFGRPERTKRMIQCILNQTVYPWEAFIIGDGCPFFQNLLDSGYMIEAAQKAEVNGNKIHAWNLETNTGGNGYQIMNDAIQKAEGEYFIFLANDDYIHIDHFSNYLEIEQTDWDYMYFNSFIEPSQSVRIAQLAYCQIGHSEIILKSSFAKTLAPHKSHYGHDWDFIAEMIEKGKGAKSESKFQTYRVMNVPSIGCVDTID